MEYVKKPPVWQKIREAVEALGGKTTTRAVVAWILKRYPGTNKGTIQCQIVICTVNHNSRIHYPENEKPRVTNTKYDFLFCPELGSGRVELYEPERHGQWEMRRGEDRRLYVYHTDTNTFHKPGHVAETETGSEIEVDIIHDHGVVTEVEAGTSFGTEAHLRDYLARNLELIEPGLELFVDDSGNDGVEYPTPIGRIDILAIDDSGGFVVIELKVSRGTDSAAGQVMRYKNWVKMNLGEHKRVRGIIIAQHISKKLLYAIAGDEDISAREYDISLNLRDAAGLP